MGCTAAGSSLIFGGFVPAASAVSYTHLIASMTIPSRACLNFTCDRLGSLTSLGRSYHAVPAAGFSSSGDRLGWFSPLLASDHDGGRALCRRANSRRASLDVPLDSKM